jgi:fatty-acyl-CoA synthase
LRRVIVVGTVASKEIMDSFKRKVPNCEVLSAYGMTETGPLVALSRPKPEEVRNLPQNEINNLKTRTGYQILGSQIKIDSKEPSTVAEGEILVRGNSVFREYFNDPDGTSKALSDGWFRTGDWGKQLPGGWIVVVDRVKDIVKSGGENISSLEVELVLNAHPNIEEAALIAVPDRIWGEVPLAVVVPKHGAKISEDDLRDYCRERLAHFKVPKSFEIREELPKTVTGKIAKEELRSKYWQGAGRKIN